MFTAVVLFPAAGAVAIVIAVFLLAVFVLLLIRRCVMVSVLIYFNVLLVKYLRQEELSFVTVLLSFLSVVVGQPLAGSVLEACVRD